MQHKQDSGDQAQNMDNHAQNNGQVFDIQNNGKVFDTQNNGQVFATQNNGQVVFATQNNGQVFATQNNGQVFATQNNGQVFATPNNGQEFDTQFPFVDQEPPRPPYPPPYTTVPLQQTVSASGICRSILVGRISLIWLGSLLVVVGAMSEASAIVAFQFSATLSEIRAGIWCGCLIISGGSVAIAAGRRETRKLIIRTIVGSAIAIVASVIQLAIAGTGLTSDIDSYSCYPPCDAHAHWQNCPCYYNDWRKSAITTNAIMVGAAVFAFIVSLWILVVTCIAIRRNPAGFQDVSAQVLANAALHNLYENSPRQQQAYPVPVQHVQQPQQQLIPLSQLPSNAAYQPTFSQVMDMPPSYIPMQTIPNQQMHSIPVQYVLQQQYQQQMPLNHPQPNTIASPTFPPQGQENYAFTQDHADDVGKAFESKWK